MQKFTPLLERASIDEAYLDITASVSLIFISETLKCKFILLFIDFNSYYLFLILGTKKTASSECTHNN